MKMDDKLKYCSLSALILFLVAAIGNGGIIKPFHWSNIFADILVLAGILYVFPFLSVIFNAMREFGKKVKKYS